MTWMPLCSAISLILAAALLRRVNSVILAGAPGSRNGKSNMPISGTAEAMKPVGMIIPGNAPACSVDNIWLLVPRDPPVRELAAKRPLECLVSSSANLTLIAACASLAVELPISTFIAGVCPSTVLAANNDAATKAHLEITFITPPMNSPKTRKGTDRMFVPPPNRNTNVILYANKQASELCQEPQRADTGA